MDSRKTLSTPEKDPVTGETFPRALHVNAKHNKVASQFYQKPLPIQKTAFPREPPPQGSKFAARSRLESSRAPIQSLDQAQSGRGLAPGPHFPSPERVRGQHRQVTAPPPCSQTRPLPHLTGRRGNILSPCQAGSRRGVSLRRAAPVTSFPAVRPRWRGPVLKSSRLSGG